MPTYVQIFGITFTICTLDEGIRYVECLIKKPNMNMIVLANAHTLNLAFELKQYRKAIKDAAVILRDGTGVGWAIKKKGLYPGHNFVGTDLIPEICRRFKRKRYKFFLFGAKPGIAERAAKTLIHLAPGLIIEGTLHGYIDNERNEFILKTINKAKPDILLVAMGNPNQELWIHANRQRLDVPVCIGVGALFDYLSRKSIRAPQWILDAGMEWVFRLLLEPRRLWKRYLVGNPKFITRVFREINKNPN